MAQDGCFQRPSAIPRRVWWKHGTFRIEDLPDSRREEVIKHLRENYLLDEPLSSVNNKTNPYKESDIRKYFNHYMDGNMALIAVDEDNNDEIAGVTILRVASKSDPYKHIEFDSQFKSYQELLDFMFYCFDGIDVFNMNETAIDYVLESVCLSVSAKYRGKGLGEALIKARNKLAANIGVGATWGLYTSIYSQALILRQPGMKVLKEVLYSDYLVDGKAKFAELNPPHPSAKVIGGLITEDMA